MALQAADRPGGDLLGRRLLGTVVAGQHHVGLEQQLLEGRTLDVEFLEERLQDAAGLAVAARDVMAAVHEHLGLHDGYQSGLL